MARQSSAPASDTCADDGLYDDGFPSIGCNSPAQYFDYAQSVFQSYRGAGKVTDGGQLIVSSAFGAGSDHDNVSDDEREMVRDSVMSILESDNLSEESVVVLSDILQIGFQVDAWSAQQYVQLRDCLKERSQRESTNNNPHVAFQLECWGNAINRIGNQRRNGLRVA
jgi:hypothetical protein